MNKHSNTQSRSTKFCTNCGAEIDNRAEICPQCGVRQPSLRRPYIKNPGAAAVLSALFPGLGQIYNGQTGKGLLFMIAEISSIAAMPIGLLPFFLIWIWGIIDAYQTAEKINAKG